MRNPTAIRIAAACASPNATSVERRHGRVGARRSGAGSGVEARSSFVFHHDQLVGVTTRDAPNGRLIAASLDAPSAWRTVVAERDVVLGGSVSRGDDILLVATREAIDTVECWRLDGTGGDPIGDLGLASIQSLDAGHRHR